MSNKQKAKRIAEIKQRVLDIWAGAHGHAFDEDSECLMSGDAEAFENFLRALADTFKHKKYEGTIYSWTYAHWNIRHFGDLDKCAEWLYEAEQEAEQDSEQEANS